jgi:hypothetical protein
MDEKVYFFYNGELLCSCDVEYIGCPEFLDIMESDPTVAQGVLNLLNSLGDPVYPVSQDDWMTAETDVSKVDIWDLYSTFMQWLEMECDDFGSVYVDEIPNCEIFSEEASGTVMGTTTIVASWKDEEMPYGFESRNLSQYDADDWAYYLATKWHFSYDAYEDLLEGLNNLQGEEWLDDYENKLKKLGCYDEFKAFVSVDDEDIDACNSIEGDTKTKTRYFANMVSASMSYDGDKYYVAGYYDNLMRGLAEDLSTDSFDAVLEFANELANDGYFIKIKNTQTGSEMHYDANVWLDAIEHGDVPEDVYEVTM